jgi:hypothetical protein
MGETPIVIPADPGWFVLTYTYAAGRVERAPVVAWRVTGATAEPVIINPAVDILCPDGSVVGTFGHFRSQDLWQESQQLAQDPRGWSDPPPLPPTAASDAKMTLDGGEVLRSRPKPESRADALRRRRAIRRSRAGGG